MTTRLRRTSLAVLAVVVAVLALGVGTASAHVSVSSPDASPGGFGEITFRVPDESDTAKTTSLKVQLPTDTPFASVSVKPVPGWTATTTTTPLNPPLTDDDGNQVTEAVGEISWTADPGGGLAPGEYQSFSMSVGPLPEDATSLAFPAVQGYDDGSTVSWVDPTVEGQAEPEHPAPTLRLADSTGTADSASATPATASESSGPSGLAVTALVVGIVGLLVGAAGVALAMSARRSTAGRTPASEGRRDSVDA